MHADLREMIRNDDECLAHLRPSDVDVDVLVLNDARRELQLVRCRPQLGEVLVEERVETLCEAELEDKNVFRPFNHFFRQNLIGKERFVGLMR